MIRTIARARTVSFTSINLRFHHFAHQHERDKNDEICNPSDAFATESNVINRDCAMDAGGQVNGGVGVFQQASWCRRR